MAEKAHRAYAVDNRNPDAFEAGTVLIDVLDAKSYKLLMRNYVVRPILRDTTAEIREERIREAVDEALKGLRIER